MARLAIPGTLIILALSAAPASGAGFLAAPTDQLAVPGLVAGAEITPEGNVYTGSAEVRFVYGPRSARWDVPTRRLTAGRLPVLRSHATAAGVRYVMTVLADAVGARPVVFVHVDATNRSRRGAPARLRAIAGDTFGRAYRFARPATPSTPGLYVQPGTPFDAAAPNVAGDTDHRSRLAPGHSVGIDLAIPVEPADWTRADAARLIDEPFAARRARVLRTWQRALAPAAVLRLPERAVQDAYTASLVHMLEPRYRLADGRWVQAVNKLQYHSFWLRDAAIIAQALDLAGLHTPAAQDLTFFAAWQRPDGLFLSRPGQLDGLGQALWALGEHARLTRDAAFASRWLEPVGRAVAWLRDARAADPLGLVPPSDPGDNELVSGHLPGDDFWAVAGLDAVAGLADVAGHPDLAADWRAERDYLRAATVAAVRAHGGAVPPAFDAPGGRDWGNLWAAWPYPVLAPRDRQVSATLRHARRGFAEGIATYGPSLHGYLGFRVFQTELARGAQRRVVDGLYSSLAHLTATDGCFELGTRPYGRRLISVDLAPHAWCAAEIVALVRTMLVRERGPGVQLLAALSPAWLGHGRTVSIAGAPTSHGPVSVALHSTARGARLTWNAPVRTPVSWTVPVFARDVRIGGRPVTARRVALPASAGTLQITWRLDADRRSLQRTRDRLAAAYRRHGSAPPFGP